MKIRTLCLYKEFFGCEYENIPVDGILTPEMLLHHLIVRFVF